MAILNVSQLSRIGGAVKNSGKRLGEATVKSFHKNKWPIIDAVDKTTGEAKKNFGNLYTGKRINPILAGGVAAGALIYEDQKHGIQLQTTEPLKIATTRDYQEYGHPDVMSYDGVSQQKAPQNMNAEGNLLFGLHNMRSGK